VDAISQGEPLPVKRLWPSSTLRRESWADHMQVGLRLILSSIAGATLVTFLFARGGAN